LARQANETHHLARSNLSTKQKIGLFYRELISSDYQNSEIVLPFSPKAFKEKAKRNVGTKSKKKKEHAA
jgi:hypothetical protein